MSEIITNTEELGSIRSDVNQVTEEAVQRVQAQSKQAKQIAQQIKKDKAINNHLAQFLTFLMQTIQDEELIKALVATFFKSTNPKNQIVYQRKNINTYVIVGFFVPFFLEEAQKAKVFWFYEHLEVNQAGSSLHSYIAYLRKISEMYHDDIPLDQGPLLTLIILITKHYLNKENRELDTIKQEVVQALYG